jgi:hypothetical protein
MSRDPNESIQHSPTVSHSTTAWQLMVAWLIVSVPTLWGVFQTIRQATALFR